MVYVALKLHFSGISGVVNGKEFKTTLLLSTVNTEFILYEISFCGFCLLENLLHYSIAEMSKNFMFKLEL